MFIFKSKIRLAKHNSWELQKEKNQLNKFQVPKRLLLFVSRINGITLFS